MMTLTTTLRAGAALLVLAASPVLAQDVDFTEAHLAVLDVDGDGSISKPEYRIFMSNVFILLDTDNDDQLQAADVADVLTADQFASVDADGDGMVSWAEFDARTLGDFDASDQNGNGALD